MYDKVYGHPQAKNEEKKVPNFIRYIFRYFMENPTELPDEIIKIAGKEDLTVGICDYIAGMTDDYAIKVFNKLFVPQSWTKL